jgi:O-antigen chain-terminating methyltransferase
MAELRERQRELQARVEAFLGQGLDEVMRYNDALFFRVDQKLDRARREVTEQSALLRAALAEPAGGEARDRQRQLLAEHRYLALEDRYRGERADIRGRVERYLPDLEGRSPVLDLGCGRGEVLEALRDAGIAAHGVDLSSEMVRRCRERGLDAEHADLLEALAARGPGSLGAVVSFHVVEHLRPEQVDALVDLAWRALRPGGLLLLETPNPQSLIAGATRFWIDPTHRRPVHPERLRSLLLTAGFETEIRPCAPFPDSERLPELTAPAASGEQAGLVYEVNALRDRLDDLLFGWQDYAALGIKPR